MKKMSSLEMFLFTIGLSLVSFGGGYITIPMLRKKLVQEKGVLSEATLQDLAAIAQSSPGSISCSLSSGVAYEVGGLPMMLSTFIATIIPPLGIISLVSIYYDSLMAQPIVQSVFKGLEIGVAVIMALLIKDMIVALYKRDHKVSILFFLISIALNLVFNLPVVFILIFNVIAVFFVYLKYERGQV